MWSKTDERRRWFGSFYLVMALGMLIWGQTILKSVLADFWFVIYWLACFVFVAMALVTALIDLRALRRINYEEQRKLFEKTFLQPENDHDSCD